MSDWGATRSSSINQGLDVEMPTGQWLNQSVIHAMLAAGNTTRHKIAESATRILWGLFQTGLMDRPNINGSIYRNVSTPSHVRLARQIAATSSVLLQNKGNILPLQVDDLSSSDNSGSSGSSSNSFGSSDTVHLSPTTIREIAVIGSQAITPIYHGGCPGAGCSPSSGTVVGAYAPSPLHSLKDALNIPSGSDCTVHIRSDGDRGGRSSGHQVCVRFNNGSDIGAAVELAAHADVSIVFVGCTGSEGRDRANLSLGRHQDQLIEAVAQAAQLVRQQQIDGGSVGGDGGSSHTIVVAVSPGPILTPWRESVAAIIAMFMPGQEYGHAVTDVLLGKASPAGKLPVTFPAEPNQAKFTNDSWCGQGEGTMYACTSNHSEGLEIGYRWYDAHNATPAFPFGHGLPGYSTFTYSALQLRTLPSSTNQIMATVSFTLENTGRRTASETPQLYLAFPPSANEPPWQLKGFQRTTTVPIGGRVQVTLPLTKRDLSIWSVDEHRWVRVEGRFGVAVGSSSRDHRLLGSIDIDDVATSTT
eukprot:SAG31_NODE_6446_length_2015_cov_1.126305_1_plen_530_part_00